jgi:hypothetical protein
MRITEVAYGRTKSKNYQSERVELTAQVEGDETPEDVLLALKARVAAELFPEEREELLALEAELERRRRELGIAR